MISNKDIVKGNYDKVFTLATASRKEVIDMLAPNVVLNDFDTGETIVSTSNQDRRGDVADHLIALRGQPQPNPKPDYREVGNAAVLCLNHMDRGQGPAPCVDVVTLDGNQLVTQIDICFVQNSGHFNV